MNEIAIFTPKVRSLIVSPLLILGIALGIATSPEAKADVPRCQGIFAVSVENTLGQRALVFPASHPKEATQFVKDLAKAELLLGKFHFHAFKHALVTVGLLDSVTSDRAKSRELYKDLVRFYSQPGDVELKKRIADLTLMNLQTLFSAGNAAGNSLEKTVTIKKTIFAGRLGISEKKFLEAQTLLDSLETNSGAKRDFALSVIEEANKNLPVILKSNTNLALDIAVGVPTIFGPAVLATGVGYLAGAGADGSLLIATGGGMVNLFGLMFGGAGLEGAANKRKEARESGAAPLGELDKTYPFATAVTTPLNYVRKALFVRRLNRMLEANLGEETADRLESQPQTVQDAALRQAALIEDQKFHRSLLEKPVANLDTSSVTTVAGFGKHVLNLIPSLVDRQIDLATRRTKLAGDIAKLLSELEKATDKTDISKRLRESLGRREEQLGSILSDLAELNTDITLMHQQLEAHLGELHINTPQPGSRNAAIENEVANLKAEFGAQKMIIETLSANASEFETQLQTERSNLRNLRIALTAMMVNRATQLTGAVAEEFARSAELYRRIAEAE